MLLAEFSYYSQGQTYFITNGELIFGLFICFLVFILIKVIEYYIVFKFFKKSVVKLIKESNNCIDKKI